MRHPREGAGRAWSFAATAVGSAVGGIIGLIVGLLPFWLWPMTFQWGVTCSAHGTVIPCSSWQSIGNAFMNILVLATLGIAGFVLGPNFGAAAGTGLALLATRSRHPWPTATLSMPITLAWLIANWLLTAAVRSAVPTPITWSISIAIQAKRNLATVPTSSWALLALAALLLTVPPALAARALTILRR